VEHAERFAGRSNYSLARQVRLAFDNFCSASILPLKTVSALGVFLCAAALGYVALILVRYFTRGISVPGWTTLAVLTAFSAGVVLLCLGVFGEYIQRILREVRRLPRYVERTRVGGPDRGDGGRDGGEP
jgi:dolichol-phosphate mannosyltransferase/undecaprenyl-phosphate 4-deoxy-4-formamido-L-arabinose transferase